MLVSVVELLGMINRLKQDGKTIDEIVRIMESKGLEKSDTMELISLLK